MDSGVLTIEGALPIDAAVDEIARIPGTAPDGRWQNFETVLPDGSVVLGLSEPRTSERLEGEEWVVASPEDPSDSFTIDQIEDGEHPYQSYGAVSSGQQIAWMTSTSTRLDTWPWALKLYDAGSRSTSTLARAPKVGHRYPPQVPGFTGPTLGGSRVFWAEVHGSPQRLRVDVMGCRTSDCRPRALSRNSALPAAASSYLYFAHPYGFGTSTSGEPFAIRRMDLGSGKIATVARLGHDRNAAPTGVAASDTAVAWTHWAGRRAAITIQNTGTRERVTVVSRPHGNFGFPVATDRFVAWSESSGNSPDQVGGYLYDLEDQKLYELGDTSGLYGISASGDVVTWQEAAKPGSPANTVVAKLQ